MEPLRVTADVVLPAADLEWKAVRASGPGGQNVNKVASKVELRFHLAGTAALDEAAKARLAGAAGSRLAADGWLTITSQLTRDRERNLADALEKLRALVARALVPPRRRRPTRRTRASERRRLEDKARHGARKRERDGGKRAGPDE